MSTEYALRPPVPFDEFLSRLPAGFECCSTTSGAVVIRRVFEVDACYLHPWRHSTGCVVITRYGTQPAVPETIQLLANYYLVTITDQTGEEIYYPTDAETRAREAENPGWLYDFI